MLIFPLRTFFKPRVVKERSAERARGGLGRGGFIDPSSLPSPSDSHSISDLKGANLFLRVTLIQRTSNFIVLSQSEGKRGVVYKWYPTEGISHSADAFLDCSVVTPTPFILFQHIEHLPTFLYNSIPNDIHCPKRSRLTFQIIINFSLKFHRS